MSNRTQILYGTHSPLFVGLDRFHQVRVFRKFQPETGKPRATQVTQVSGNTVAEELWEATDPDNRPAQKFTWDTLAPRLRTLMTPWMGEGFFADVAVLAEGEDDRAALLGTALAMGYDLESQGIAVIPCGGKPSLDRPLSIFRRFGIITYVVWDGDYGNDEAHPETNRLLLRLLSRPVEDYPTTQATPEYTCFHETLESTLQDEIGTELFESTINDCKARFAIPKNKHAMKNPIVIEELVKVAEAKGHPSNTLRDAVTYILARKLQTDSGLQAPRDAS